MPVTSHRTASALTAGALLTLLAGCGGAPEVEGVVRDPWGNPVAGATVKLETQVEAMVSNDAGEFSFDALPTEMRLLAGKDGFILGTAVVTPLPEGEDDYPKVEIILYPEPEKPGFYAVDVKDYAHLAPLSVKTVGTELQAYTGLVDIGRLSLGGDQQHRFVFTTPLRQSELSRLDLQLHRLAFKDNATVSGVLGEEQVRVNLYVADTSVPFDIRGMASKEDYLIVTREKLPAGEYAFHIQSVLTSSDPAALDKLPREYRVAYPFEVR